MPRKVNDVLLIEDPPSLQVSFCDDEALPPGIIFTDFQQKQWRIGKPIGRGSFGRIYLASDDIESEVTKTNARYVVKIEPYKNGPLFVEVHCLVRIAQASQVKNWRQQQKKKHFGMPIYIANGSFTNEMTDEKYRFLILPRYDCDLQKIIARTRVLDVKNVLILAIQILDVLEYLHSQGYTHSDIKSSNLMLGFDSTKFNKVQMKSAISFQKETKEVSILSGKQRKIKTGKTRSSNYYDDEDFIIKDQKSKFNPSCSPNSERERNLDKVKNKLRKILSDKDNRTLHRHHAFNLRQLTNYVNYEDMTSSVCSDQSYQKLVDNIDSKNLNYSSDEGFHDDPKFRNKNMKTNTGISELEEVSEHFQEAILSQSAGQIYLLDYGLASKFIDSSGSHKEFCIDERKAHDGTLEYSSRDSHVGAHSRRSDLETLAYNLLDWLTGTLPWKTKELLAEPDLVHAIKKNFMSNVKYLLKTCFKTEFYPQFMEKFLEYVISLDFVEKPDYDYCRSLFRAELLRNGYTSKEYLLNFGELSMTPMSRKKLYYSKRFGRKNTPTDFIARNGITKKYERENICSLENDLKLELLRQTLNSSSDGIRKPCSSRNFFISDADLVARLKKSLMPYDVLGKKLSPKNLRSNKRNIQIKKGKRSHKSNIGKFGNFMGSARQFTWAEILAGNPEDIIRKERTAGKEEEDDDETCKYRIRKLSSDSSDSYDTNLQSLFMQKDYKGLNLTPAMKEVIANFRKNVSGKVTKDTEEELTEYKGFTPAMIRLQKIKEKREAKEKLEAAKLNSTKNTPVKVTTRCTRARAYKDTLTKVNLTSVVNKKKTAEEKISDTKTSPSTEVAVDNVKNKCKTRKTSTRVTNNKKAINKQKVTKTAEETKSESPKPTVKPPSKRKYNITSTNRMKLRSSKRTRN